MHLKPYTYIFILIFSLCIGAAAQNISVATPTPTPADPEAEAKLKAANEQILQILDQATRDGAGLRLPLNRAIVFTLAGDLLWNLDEKRARELFREVPNEIILYNQETEKERSDNSRNNFMFFDNSDPRGELLPMIAAHDPQLALEMLYVTRPAKLTEAMMRGSTATATTAGPNGGPGGGRGMRNNDGQSTTQEQALEQKLILMAANADPDKAVKLIGDTLAKGVTNSVIQPLQELYKKDAKKADELAGKVVSALVNGDWSANPQYFRLSLSFIQLGNSQSSTAKPGEKVFRFSDEQDRTLALKIVSYLTQPGGNGSNNNQVSQALQVIQRYAPEKAAQLRQTQTASPQNARNAQRQAMFSSTSTPEDILGMIPKMQSDGEKSMAYSALGSKISQITDDARAQKLLGQIPDDKARASASDQYEAAKVARSAAGGDLDSARALIGKVAEPKTKIRMLVSLATAFYKKGTEKDVAAAQDLMKDARNLVNTSPEDEDELADLMEVVSGYAVVEPDAGFRIMEPIVDQFNEMVNASAVLSRYDRRNRSFRKGELVLKASAGGGGFRGGPGGFGGPGDQLFYRYIRQFQLLGRSDLDQASRLADRFSRTDARTIVKLYIVRGVLSDDRR